MIFSKIKVKLGTWRDFRILSLRSIWLLIKPLKEVNLLRTVRGLCWYTRCRLYFRECVLIVGLNYVSLQASRFRVSCTVNSRLSVVDGRDRSIQTSCLTWRSARESRFCSVFSKIKNSDVRGLNHLLGS